MTLAVINLIVWGALIALLPGTHFAWPGAYKFWWFDDVPWTILTASTIAPVLLKVSPFGSDRRVKMGAAILLTITLVTALPYAACSGGGV